MTFFSVIIPLYNKEKYIQNTIQSVLNQHFNDFEIIVVNDGSTDLSGKKVTEINDSRIHYFETENQGVSEARNYGVKQSKGKFICFLDADDYWYPHFLSEVYKYILKFPEQKVFATAIEFEIKNKAVYPSYSIDKSGDYKIVNYFEASLKESVLFTSASVFERSVFEVVGYFNPKYKSGQDTDLWVRVGLNFPIVFIKKICVRYIYDAKSLSRSRKKILEKAEFFEYVSLEKTNPALKRFLDYNRFSLAIECKLNNQKEKFQTFYKLIDNKNLPFRKQLLLQLPAWVLSILIKIKNYMTFIGLGNSVFRG